MSSLSHVLLLATTLILMLFSAPLGARCTNRSPISSPQAMLMEEKIRLGSTPPSCHNRCNTCNPCTAVQVPTLPARAARLRSSESDGGGGELSFNEFANYKPLGWKCRCRDHLYDP
uniref:Epidermal patterning factor-like protein n=1 Tax=Ananas comosus var. bracteatus TaxID=296719 RepID=A0A6V7P7Y1_ANACO|nr:unnamed protein product [Ananas comosus var. bracteatus]